MSQTNSETSIACTRGGNCVASHGEPDLPAESHELKIGEDIDWIDVSSVYERDDSVKETTNPKSHTHAHSSQNAVSNSTSQRFSGNLKPAIIGLPGKIQNSSYVGHSARRRFPKKVKTGGGGKKQAMPETEPGSPKVSCIGKVLSERERARRRRRREKSPKEKTPAKEEEERTGCWVTVAGIFCRRRKRLETEGGVASKETRSTSERAGETPVTVEVAVGPPEIGGMKRFASGRKVDWNFEVTTDEGKR